MPDWEMYSRIIDIMDLEKMQVFLKMIFPGPLKKISIFAIMFNVSTYFPRCIILPRIELTWYALFSQF